MGLEFFAAFRLIRSLREKGPAKPGVFRKAVTLEAGGRIRSQFDTASKRNIRYLPIAFTEHGALMAANVLNSPRAVAMSVCVIRAFVKMREDLAANAAILRPLGKLMKPSSCTLARSATSICRFGAAGVAKQAAKNIAEEIREQGGFLEIVRATGSDEARPVLESGLPVPEALRHVERPHLLPGDLRVKERFGFESHLFGGRLCRDGEKPSLSDNVQPVASTSPIEGAFF